MKYIIVELQNDIGYNHPFIFPDMLSHDLFFENIQRQYLMDNNISIKILSAGFCNFFGQNPNCHGKSLTLKIGSRMEIDDRIISMFDYEHGIIM